MPDQKTRGARLNKASAEASAKLKAAHIDEWNDYMVQAAAALGEKWEPRLTPEQRAEQEFNDLLAANPALAEKYGVTVPVRED